MKTQGGRVVDLAGLAPYPRAARLSLATQRLVLTLYLLVTDALALLAAFRLAYWIRFELQITVAADVVGSLEDYQGLAALLVPVWLSTLALFSLYESHTKFGGIVESSRTFNACTTATMFVVLGTFLQPQFVVSRMWLVSAWALTFLGVATNRFLARRIVYTCRSRGFLLSPTVIIGTNEEAASLAAFLQDWRASGVRLLGLVGTGSSDVTDDPSGFLLGTTDDLTTLVRERGVEDVIVAITALGREELLAVCEEVDDLPVQLRLSTGLYELLTTRVEVHTLGTVPLMSLQKNRLSRSEVFVKSVIERTITLGALLVLSPVLLSIALLIRLDSAGPAIYRRRVLGVSGRQFDAFKFRTMHVNGAELLQARPEAAEELRTNHKLKDDPRVTRVGRWLRKYSLDELPQLFNVLLGQMALVGPRMITPEEADKYGRQRMNLLTVKPGITGLWQVSGRSDLSYEERVRIDMYYVRNYSVWLDLQILFIQTLPAVLHGRGAY